MVKDYTRNEKSNVLRSINSWKTDDIETIYKRRSNNKHKTEQKTTENKLLKLKEYKFIHLK